MADLKGSNKNEQFNQLLIVLDKMRDELEDMVKQFRKLAVRWQADYHYNILDFYEKFFLIENSIVVKSSTSTTLRYDLSCDAR